MLIFSHRVWKVRFMNLGAYPELLSPTRAGCSYGTKLVTQSVNKQTHSRCLHRSANTEEAFISVSNHVCGKRRGSVFPATAFSSQMISVLPQCCGEVFQFSIQNQDSQDKFNYKENIVTNYFQSNAQLLPQPQKEMPAQVFRYFSLQITLPALLQNLLQYSFVHKTHMIGYITQSHASSTSKEITEQDKVTMDGTARGMLAQTDKPL